MVIDTCIIIFMLFVFSQVNPVILHRAPMDISVAFEWTALINKAIIAKLKFLFENNTVQCTCYENVLDKCFFVCVILVYILCCQIKLMRKISNICQREHRQNCLGSNFLYRLPGNIGVISTVFLLEHRWVSPVFVNYEFLAITSNSWSAGKERWPVLCAQVSGIVSKYCLWNEIFKIFKLL